jgi:putative DNA primase/helicase
MVRSPLVWLGEPDPILTIEEIREEDPELTNIRELFDLWLNYLRLDTTYSSARLIEIAEEQNTIGYVHPGLKELFLKVASMRGKESQISPERLGRFLRRVSGRPVKQHRLLKGQDRTNVASYRPVEAL